MKTQYWLVGATWGGSEDVLPKFLTRGYWYCWDINKFSNEQSGVGNTIKNQQQRFEKVLVGDRIAVKRLRGQGATDMSVLAIGIVKDVDVDEWRIYIDWVAHQLGDRRVPLKGCTAAIHGPFLNEDEDSAWVNQVFSL